MISVCVFLASSHGHDPTYAEVARATGAAIAARGWRLVYGGAHRGLMGVLADACLAAGGEVRAGLLDDEHRLAQRQDPVQLVGGQVRPRLTAPRDRHGYSIRSERSSSSGFDAA